MFAVLGIILSLFAIGEISNRIKYNAKFFDFFAILLLVILCFRYGQGTDYSAYEWQFAHLDTAGSYLINTLGHGEIGWYMLMLFFKRLGATFSAYVGFISLLMMIPTINIIKKYSPYKIFSLLILYPTYYLTYYCSGLRQGITIALFLAIGIDFLANKKYIKYYLLVLVATLFHTSAIVLAMLPTVLKFKGKRPEKWIMVAVVFATISGYAGLLNNLAMRLRVGGYFQVTISPMAILLRFILFYIVSTLYNATRESGDGKNFEDILYYIYSFGFLVYIMLGFSSTLSQRLTASMKSIEVILIPILAAKMNKFRKLGLMNRKSRILYFRIGRSSIIASILIVILALNVEMLKNLNSYLSQGEYYEWVNVFSYPYISIFNKSDIFNYTPYLN